MRSVFVWLCSLSLFLSVGTARGDRSGYGDDHFTRPRLPPILETVFIFALSWSNLNTEEERQDPKHPKRLSERSGTIKTPRDQLILFRSMLAFLKQAFNEGEEEPKKDQKFKNLRAFVEAKEPMRANTGTLEGDIGFLMDLLASGVVLKPVSVDPRDAKAERYFDDMKTKVDAELFMSDRDERLKNALRGTNTLIGTVIGSVLGSFVEFTELANKAGDALTLFGDVYDIAGGDRLLREVSNVLGVVAPSLAIGKGMKIRDIVTGGSDTKPSLIDQNIKRLQAVKSVQDSLTDIDKKVLQFLLKAEGRGELFQRQVIQFFELQIQRLAKHLSEVGTMVAESEELKDAIHSQEGGLLLRVFQFLLNKYPARLPSDMTKNILLALLRSDLNASNLKALAIIMDYLDPNLKNLAQALAQFSEMGELASVLEFQQRHGRTIPFEEAKKIMKADPNHYNINYDKLNPVPIGSGKSFTVYEGEAEDPDTGEMVPVAIRVMLPDALRMAQVGKLILEALAPGITSLLNGKDPDTGKALEEGVSEAEIRARFEELGLEEKSIKKIIRAICRLTEDELNIPLTVQNQTVLAPRFTQERLVEIDDTVVSLRFRSPKAWKAVPGSTVMLSRLVEDRISLEDLMASFEGVGDAMGLEVFRSFLTQGLIKPLQNAASAPPPPVKKRWWQFWKRSAPAETRAVEDGEAVDGEAAEKDESKQGALNVDDHPGNFVFKRPSFTTLAEIRKAQPDALPHLSDQTAAHVIEVSRVDWGLAVTLPENRHIYLLLLAIGTDHNHWYYTAQALWNLQDNPDRNLEMKAEFEQAIYDRIRELDRRWEVRPPEYWVKYAMRWLNFDKSLVAIDRGVTMMNSFLKKTGTTAGQKEKVLNEIIKENFGVLKTMLKDHGGVSALVKLIWRKVKHRARFGKSWMGRTSSCVLKLIGRGPKYPKYN